MRKSSVSLLFLLCISFFNIQAFGDNSSQAQDKSYLNTINNLVDESRNEIKRAEKQRREDAAKTLYEKGLELTEQGRFDEARDYFERAIRMTEKSEMALHIKEGEERLKLQEAALKKAQVELASEKKNSLAQQEQKRKKELELAKAKEREELEQKKQHEKELNGEYQKALSLYKQKNYLDAQKAFKELESKETNFKDVHRYLNLIDDRLAQQQALKERRQQEDLEKQQRAERQAKAKEEERKRAEELKKEKEAQKQKEAEEHRQALEKQKAMLEEKRRQEELRSQQEEQKRIEQKKQEEEAKNKLEEERKRKEEDNRKALEEKKAQEEKARQEEQQRLLEQKKKDDETRMKKEQEAKQQEQEKQKALEEQRQKEEALKQQESAKQKAAEQQKIEEEKRKSGELEKQKQHDEEILAQKKQKDEEERQRKDAQLAKDREEESKRQAEMRRQQDEKEKVRKQADEDYRTALEFFREHKYKESKEKFESVNVQWPGYKATDAYLRKIGKILVSEQKRQDEEKQKALELQKREDEKAKRIQEAHQKWVESQKDKIPAEHKPVPASASMQTASGAAKVTNVPQTASAPAVSMKEQQENEARLLASLAERSSRLFRQISELADDKSTVAAKNKLAKVDQVINNLKQEKEKTLVQIHEEEQRRYEQEIKEKERLRLQEAQKAYEEAIDLLGSKDFDGAKRKFLEVENIQANYKSTRNYLNRIYQDQRKVQEEAIAEKAREKQRKFEEEESQRRLQEAQKRQERISQLESRLNEIGRKASGINDDILKLAANRDYNGAKTKFDELESAMNELKQVKESLASEREQDRLIKSQAKDKENSSQESQRVLQEKNSEAIRYNIERARKEQILNSKEAQAFRAKEEANQRNVIFHQAIDFYKAKKYRESKLIFEELAAKGDRRAIGYLNKIEHIEEKDNRKINQSSEQKENEYLSRRLHDQRKERILDSQDQKRQRKLSQELEKQKQLLENQRQQERRKLETLKLQEKQRQRLEKQREAEERQKKKQEQQLRFRKVEPASKAPVKPKSEPVEKLTFSKVTKDSLEDKKKEADKAALEKKEQLEAEQAKELQEKEKAQIAVKEQERKKTELEKSIKERQDKLEAERKAVRAQLESGVEAMYNEAVKLYKSGQYGEAAKRFSDVEDLIPNYKKSGVYLKKAQSRLPKAAQPSSVKKESSAPSVQPQQAVNSSRKDEIAKTLDLFDSK